MSIKSEITLVNNMPKVELVVDTDEGRIKFKDVPNRKKGMKRDKLKTEARKELKRNPKKRRGPKPNKKLKDRRK